MNRHYPPEFKKREFNCPYCGVYAGQYWAPARYYNGSAHAVVNDVDFSQCRHCGQFSVWVNEILTHPQHTTAPMPHPDTPEHLVSLYNEASAVYNSSPRAAAALLRLLLQKLLIALGEIGKNINDDIGSLVSKGLSPQIQQALDICRVIGNNAVHPSHIAEDELPSIAFQLFGLINFIIEDRISRSRAIQELYDKLPQGATLAIEKRDA